MQRSFLVRGLLGLSLLGSTLVATGCDDKRPSAPAAEQITVDPSDVARLKLRFGDRLGAELGVPVRVAPERMPVADKAGLHRDLAHKSRILARPPALPSRTRPLASSPGGER